MDNESLILDRNQTMRLCAYLEFGQMMKKLKRENPFNVDLNKYITEEVELCNGLKSLKIIKNPEWQEMSQEEKDLWLLMQRSYIDGYMEVRGRI